MLVLVLPYATSKLFQVEQIFILILPAKKFSTVNTIRGLGITVVGQVSGIIGNCPFKVHGRRHVAGY